MRDNSFKTSVYFMPWFVTYPQELEGLRAGSGLKKTVLRASSTYRNELADNWKETPSGFRKNHKELQKNKNLAWVKEA